MRVSRIPKVDTIPTQKLVHLARDMVFGCFERRRFFYFLESASKRGDVQAQWMLNNFKDVPDSFNIELWVVKRFDGVDDPYAKYFVARIQKSTHLHVESGCSWSAVHVPLLLRSNSVEPEAIWRNCKDDDFISIYRASNMYYGNAIRDLLMYHSNKLKRLEYAKWIGRCFLYSLYMPFQIESDEERYIESDEERYIVGREIQGHEEINSSRLFPVSFDSCIEYYLNCSHRARRSALFTTFALRKLLGRDVARMIGKFVYSTRGEEWG